MWQLTVRNLLARKRRVLLTAVAIILGVAFIGATQILGATVDRSLTASAGDFYDRLAADVRGDDTGAARRAPVPTALGEQLAGIDGVTQVIDLVLEPVTVVRSSGKVLPTSVTAGTWFDGDVQPLQVAEGRPPAAAGELAVTDDLADDGGFALGDTVRYESVVGPNEGVITGILEVNSDSIAGVPALVLSPDAADRLLPAGSATELAVVGDPGVVEQVRAAADASGQPLEVRSGEVAAGDAVADAKSAARIISTVFGVFGLLSLFVGLFIIYNTFTILLAQRKREIALLRAIGVRRKQITRSVLGEAAVVGVVSGVIGSGLGVLIAVAGRGALLGDIDGSLVVGPTAIVSGLVIGLVATVWSSWGPARKASKVPPIEALRESSNDSSSRSVPRMLAGMVLAALTVLFVVLGLQSDDSPAQLVGVAAFLGLLSLIALSPLLAVLLVPVFGAPVRALRGQVGALAMQNARRQPQRTASTATALLLGVAIVGLALVIADSLRASVSSALEDRVSADYVVTPVIPGTSLSPASIDAVGAAAGGAPIDVSTLVVADIDGSDKAIFAVDTTLATPLTDFRPEGGSLMGLGPDGIMVDEHAADDEGWVVGDAVTVGFASGQQRTYTIDAIGQTRPFGSDYVIDSAEIGELDPRATVSMVLVGAGADRSALEQALAGFPNAELNTPSSLVDQISSQINLLLTVLFGFLGLSVIIAFIGVANTLALSIHERTRELGILRAIALRRSHVRSAVRWEAAIISALGSALGIVYGAGFGIVLAMVLERTGFARLSIPWGQLVLVVIGAALAGSLAAALPARRAAKLNVLDAIHQA